MCFSATASFITASVTGAVGIAAILQAREAREIPLAAMPLFFAAQQFFEGALWLTLPEAPAGTLTSIATHAFLIFALVFWPIYAPAAALALEVEPQRRWAMTMILVLGIGVAAYFVLQLIRFPHIAQIEGGHISYGIANTPLSIGGAYLVATTLPLLLSSFGAVAVLGLLVLTGSIVTYAGYQESFISVWCFFAAAASVVIAGHFAWQRRRTPAS
jgi:hypothetical protein